mgnify:CR=1 FL=1
MIAPLGRTSMCQPGSTGVLVVDADNQVRLMNEAAWHLLGGPRADLHAFARLAVHALGLPSQDLGDETFAIPPEVA